MDIVASREQLARDAAAAVAAGRPANPYPVGTLVRQLWDKQLRRLDAVKLGRRAAQDQAAGQFVLNPYVEHTVEHGGWAEGFDAESRVMHRVHP